MDSRTVTCAEIHSHSFQRTYAKGLAPRARRLVEIRSRKTRKQRSDAIERSTTKLLALAKERTIALSSASGLPEVGPADKVDDADDGDEDGANVEKELGGGVAVLVGGLTGHSQEEKNQAGEAEENGPKRDAGDVCGQGRHAGMLAEKQENIPFVFDFCPRLIPESVAIVPGNQMYLHTSSFKGIGRHDYQELE